MRYAQRSILATMGEEAVREFTRRVSATGLQQTIREYGSQLSNAIQRLADWNDERAAAYTTWLRESGENERMAQRNQAQPNMLDHAASMHERNTMGNKKQKLLEAPVSNTPATATMDEEEHGGTNGHEGGEQQVTKPAHIWKRFPNTETAKLRWVQTQYLSNTDTSKPPYNPWNSVNDKRTTDLTNTDGGAAINPAFDYLNQISYGHDFQTPWLIQLRMTSPYNIVKTFGTTNTAITATVGNSQPAWLELFDSKYEYYHVMQTEWTLKFVVGVAQQSVAVTGNIPATSIGYDIFYRYTNQDEPYLSYSQTNGIAYTNAVDENTQQMTNAALATTVGTVNMTPDDYLQQGGWHHRHVTTNSTHPTEVVINGTYKFGQCKMDIKTIMPSDTESMDSTAEGWSKAQSTAAFPENLSVIIVQDNQYNGVAGSVKTPMSVRMMTDQTIQFKDLQRPYKFPTNGYNQQNTAVTKQNTDMAFFRRGAAYT